jgi:copper chaperone NosL
MKRETLQTAIDGFYRFLDQPLYLWARPVLFALVLPLLVAVSQPLWRIELSAPQYPAGLSVDIYAYDIVSGHDNKDLREINILNHYVGMKKIERSAFADLDWLPFGFGLLGVLLLRVAVIGNVRSLLDMAVMVGYFGAFSAGRFVYKLWIYGHDLAPDAPVKVAPFMPAVLGTKQVGNFTTHAAPAVGTYLFSVFVLGVLGLAATHLVQGRRKALRRSAEQHVAAVAAESGAALG